MKFLVAFFFILSAILQITESYRLGRGDADRSSWLESYGLVKSEDAATDLYQRRLQTLADLPGDAQSELEGDAQSELEGDAQSDLEGDAQSDLEGDAQSELEGAADNEGPDNVVNKLQRLIDVYRRNENSNSPEEWPQDGDNSDLRQPDTNSEFGKLSSKIDEKLESSEHGWKLSESLDSDMTDVSDDVWESEDNLDKVTLPESPPAGVQGDSIQEEYGWMDDEDAGNFEDPYGLDVLDKHEGAVRGQYKQIKNGVGEEVKIYPHSVGEVNPHVVPGLERNAVDEYPGGPDVDRRDFQDGLRDTYQYGNSPLDEDANGMLADQREVPDVWNEAPYDAQADAAGGAPVSPQHDRKEASFYPQPDMNEYDSMDQSNMFDVNSDEFSKSVGGDGRESQEAVKGEPMLRVEGDRDDAGSIKDYGRGMHDASLYDEDEESLRRLARDWDVGDGQVDAVERIQG